MGGEVFVGVRDLNHKEHLALCWTNPMPYWLADVDFYSSPEVLQKFLGMAKSGNTWPDDKPTDRVEPSEYGVILIDFPNRRVFSRQDYTQVGHLLVHGRHINGDDASLVTKLSTRGWITRVWDVGDDAYFEDPSKKLDPVIVQAFLQSCALQSEAIARRVPIADLQRDFGLVGVDFQIEGWTLDHKSDRADTVWPEVVAWLKGNEWVSPVEAPGTSEESD